MKQTLIVACPKLLTELFGCPEWVKLPTKINEKAEYTAHNRRFVVCSVGRGRLWLESPLHDSRTLFGTPEETAERIGYTFEHGTLPQEPFALRNDPPAAPKLPKAEAKRQAVLFSGMDCLEGQNDLFETDGAA